jgi:hypothetical protein
MEKDRMRLARIGTPQQDDIRLFYFAVRTRAATRSEDRRQTDDAGRVSSPVATVNVVAADHGAHKFLRGIVQFIGGLRATEHPESFRPARLNFSAEACRSHLQSFIPAGSTMLAIFTNKGSCQPLARSAFHILSPGNKAHG